MKAAQVASELLKTPDAEVLQRVGGDWVEVFSVQPTGEHRNAVTLRCTEEITSGQSGVIVYTEPSER